MNIKITQLTKRLPYAFAITILFISSSTLSRERVANVNYWHTTPKNIELTFKHAYIREEFTLKSFSSKKNKYGEIIDQLAFSFPSHDGTNKVNGLASFQIFYVNSSTCNPCTVERGPFTIDDNESHSRQEWDTRLRPLIEKMAAADRKALEIINGQLGSSLPPVNDNGSP
ncbi:hypothetical protein [Dyella flagellata]|uniref:Uncharacterized protein n=1 Tax=Dyella flagellata TaxID=1867833 RepID=A0ABQ5XCU9_9GAMM|nr:hypothetical protein [Dyella flagellata]GLQ89478.1 hypothetical protein GCM10007898_30510 [Dyella flagellata]